MRVININSEKFYLKQYVRLRNKNRKLLVTGKISLKDTIRWMEKERVEVVGLTEGKILLGAAVLYLNKKNEVAFFARYPGKGIGTLLLKHILKLAKRKKLTYVWAWALKSNAAALHVLKKVGFVTIKEIEINFEGRARKGIKLKKSF